MLMEGIIILNQTQVIVQTAFNWYAFVVGFFVGAVIGMLFSILFLALDDDYSTFSSDFGVCCVLVVVCGIIVGVLSASLIAPTIVAEETQYEVLITEDVDIQTFLTEYEIVEQRGQIYQVRKINSN